MTARTALMSSTLGCTIRTNVKLDFFFFFFCCFAYCLQGKVSVYFFQKRKKTFSKDGKNVNKTRWKKLTDVVNYDTAPHSFQWEFFMWFLAIASPW